MDLEGFDLLQERKRQNLNTFSTEVFTQLQAAAGLLKSHQEMLFPHCDLGGGGPQLRFWSSGLGSHHVLMHCKTLLSGLGGSLGGEKQNKKNQQQTLPDLRKPD